MSLGYLLSLTAGAVIGVLTLSRVSKNAVSRSGESFKIDRAPFGSIVRFGCPILGQCKGLSCPILGQERVFFRATLSHFGITSEFFCPFPLSHFGTDILHVAMYTALLRGPFPIETEFIQVR